MRYNLFDCRPETQKQPSYYPDFVIPTAKPYVYPSAPPLEETEHDIHLQHQAYQYTESSKFKQRIINVTEECAALRGKVAILENIHNAVHEVEASQAAHKRVTHAVTEDVQDLKLTMDRLSSELQELKVSHSVARQEHK
jgi:hypothetical protein